MIGDVGGGVGIVGERPPRAHHGAADVGLAHTVGPEEAPPGLRLIDARGDAYEITGKGLRRLFDSPVRLCWSYDKKFSVQPSVEETSNDPLRKPPDSPKGLTQC